MFITEIIDIGAFVFVYSIISLKTIIILLNILNNDTRQFCNYFKRQWLSNLRSM